MKIDVDLIRTNRHAASVLLKAMCNERRLMILCYLMEGEKSVSELEQLIGISQSALSQHLARLRRDNVVTTRREAQSIFYSHAGGQVPVVLRALEKISKKTDLPYWLQYPNP